MKKKCQVVMLSTEKVNGIMYFDKNDNDLSKHNLSYSYKPQHLYILSVDIPKIGDLILEHNNKGGYYIPKKCYDFQEFKGLKIIATTDPDLQKEGVASIPQGFISKYVTEHNKGNVIFDVMVEYDPKMQKIATGEIVSGSTSDYNLTLKLRSDNTVIIHKVLKEIFTLEDMKKAFKAGFIKVSDKAYDIGNLMMEEYLGEADTNFEDWFNQQEF